MKLIESRLVAECDIEQTVLQNVLMDHLLSSVEAPDFLEATVGDPGEDGAMAVEARWECGSLHCEAWIEICTGCACSEAIRCGDFHLTLGWRTPEQEGYWDTLDEILQWNDPDEDDQVIPRVARSR